MDGYPTFHTLHEADDNETCPGRCPAVVAALSKHCHQRG